MNEVCYEETAFPYDYKKQKVFYIICKVLIGISIAIAIFFGILFLFTPLDDGSWIFPVSIVVWSILSIVLLMFIKSKLYCCYDYIFVTGDIRIIKVVNTKKRKKLVIMDSSNVFQVGRFESETYIKHTKAPNVKIIYAPTNKFVVDTPKFYIAGVVDGVNYILVLECTEKFLVQVLKFAGKHVLEKDFTKWYI